MLSDRLKTGLNECLSEFSDSTVDRHYQDKDFTHTVLPFPETSWIITAFEFCTIIINILDFYLKGDFICEYYCAIWTIILVE